MTRDDSGVNSGGKAPAPDWLGPFQPGLLDTIHQLELRISFIKKEKFGEGEAVRGEAFRRFAPFAPHRSGTTVKL